MTPLEKAKSLFETFSCDGDIRDGVAVALAIACCDEVIAEIEDLQQNCLMEFPMALEYWQQVKTHLQSI